MRQDDMRRVILGATRGDDPATSDEVTGACRCGQPDCWHCKALAWRVQIHSSSTYDPLHELQYELKDLGREDLYPLLLDAAIGLTGIQIRALGELVLSGVKAETQRMNRKNRGSIEPMRMNPK